MVQTYVSIYDYHLIYLIETNLILVIKIIWLFINTNSGIDLINLEIVFKGEEEEVFKITKKKLFFS